MKLEKNQIHQGDCVELLGQIECGSVDLVFADPPFNIGYKYDVYDDSQNAEDYIAWCGKWIKGIHRALKSSGTFWLAIGDEYAAELKIASQQAGFHCRSWVIWYYTFGVNCANGFSRSHTHLFHFVKDPKNFTFVRSNPNIRVKSARQLVYADARSNPAGRLPDNTWITRPQDAPDAFRPNHDTWFFSRVAGTFKEREGFHGCQMPEQLLARIIRTSSNPCDTVLDPFGGSGTTLCVAKKLRRDWIGLELSKDYVKHINRRLDQTSMGEPIDGPEDPVESAPGTAAGKRRKKQDFDAGTIQAVVESYQAGGEGFPADYILCDRDLDKSFVRECKKRGIGGNPIVWNRLMLKLRKSGRLPRSTRRPPQISTSELNQYGFASEVAWRLVSDEFKVPGRKPPSLDDLLCCPDTAEYFDQIAAFYGPADANISPLKYRRAALAIRKMAKAARSISSSDYRSLSRRDLVPIELNKIDSSWSRPGVFRIGREDQVLFAGDAEDLLQHLSSMFEIDAWKRLAIDKIHVGGHENGSVSTRTYKSVLVREKMPLLNAHAWFGGTDD